MGERRKIISRNYKRTGEERGICVEKINEEMVSIEKSNRDLQEIIQHTAKGKERVWMSMI